MPIDDQRGGHVLDQRLEGAQQDRQSLALLGAADEQDPQLAPTRGFGLVRRRPRRSTPLGMIS